MKRHWSFIVCDPRYLYPLALLLLIAGVVLAFHTQQARDFARFGNLIIGTGVWMSLRYTLREGINRYKDASADSPTVPGTNALNSAYFANISFGIGDANLQVHGFVLVLIGSVVGSFGDIILLKLFPQCLH